MIRIYNRALSQAEITQNYSVVKNNFNNLPGNTSQLP